MTKHDADLTGEAPASGGIAAAEAGVARAGLAFSASLHDASLVGRETAERVVSAMRPLLIGLGILAGAAVAARLLRGRSRASDYGRPRSAVTSSVWSEVARSAAITLATVAGRRLVDRWLGPQVERAVRRL